VVIVALPPLLGGDTTIKLLFVEDRSHFFERA
jgi:hypothetical protein